MTVERHNGAFLDPIERPVLAWLAERVPRALTPDGLTLLGFIGALCACAGYALAPRQAAMLWLAIAGIALNWLGDSLDGTIARRRGIERPRYGFFLDNSFDTIEQALVAVGLGLSGLVDWGLAAAVLASFFMVSLLALLQAQVSKVLEIAYYGIGGTEMRCAFVLWTVAVFFFPPRPFEVFGVSVTYSDVVAVVFLLSNMVVFLSVMTRELRRLALEEPPRGT